MAKYDVAVYGLWYGYNYGSMITYYALSKVLDSLGKTYAMIKNPLGRMVDVSTLCKSHPLRFADKHYTITPLYGLDEMYKLNEMFDTFLIGSDQMWNYWLSKSYQQSYYFDFVDDDKNKIAYGTSFGHEGYDGPQSEIEKVKKNLSRFNAVSVRDDFSKKMCEEIFGVKAETVMDPVLLCPVQEYETIIKESTIAQNDDSFIFAYILNPDKVIGEQLKALSQKTGKRIILIFDALYYIEGRQAGDLMEQLGLEIDNKISMLYDATVEDWLYCFKNADYVITDSFHGTCFSVIFKKQFLSIRNNIRGGSRFNVLLDSFGLSDHLLENASALMKNYEEVADKINYDVVYEKIDKIKKESLEWLENALKK